MLGALKSLVSPLRVRRVAQGLPQAVKGYQWRPCRLLGTAPRCPGSSSTTAVWWAHGCNTTACPSRGSWWSWPGWGYAWEVAWWQRQSKRKGGEVRMVKGTACGQCFTWEGCSQHLALTPNGTSQFSKYPAPVLPKDNRLYFPRARKSPLGPLPKYWHQNNLLYPEKLLTTRGRMMAMDGQGSNTERILPSRTSLPGGKHPQDLVCLFGLPAHLNRSGSFGISLVSCIQQWCTFKSLELLWKCPHLIQLLPVRSEAVYGIIGKQYQTTMHSLPHNTKFHSYTCVEPIWRNLS